MHIPHEVAVEILLRLPVKSIIRFRCVCKKWCKFLKHNSGFVSKRLDHSIEKNSFTLLFTIKDYHSIFSINNDPSSSVSHVDIQKVDKPFGYTRLEIFGSCNGVLFIKIDPELVIGLWNPTTKEYKIIPDGFYMLPIGFTNELYSPKIHGRKYIYGFGYDRRSNDYKLVEIISPSNDEIMVAEVNIYTMRSDSWKRIDYMPYKIMDEPPGVFVNGALHWLANPCSVRSKNTFPQVVLSFNMAAEVFIEIPHLEYFDDGNRFEHKRIDVLEGVLAMLCSHSNVGFEVWVMNDYGVKESWTKRYTISRLKINFIPSFRYLRRIHSLKNMQILLEIQLDDNYKYATLVFYDSRSERARAVEIDLGDKWWIETTGNHLKARIHTEAYVESLVSLHSGTYVGGGQERSDLGHALSIYCDDG